MILDKKILSNSRPRVMTGFFLYRLLNLYDKPIVSNTLIYSATTGAIFIPISISDVVSIMLGIASKIGFANPPKPG